MFEWVLDIVKVLGGTVGLLYGGDYLVRGAAQLARSLGVSVMVVGLTIVAMGTSMPELVVSVFAAVKGVTDVTVGNAIGSNLFNLLPTLGLIAVVRPVIARSAFIHREIPVMLGAMTLAWLFCLPGTLIKPLAGALLVCLAIYLWVAVRLAQKERERHVVAEFDEGIPSQREPIWKNLFLMSGGFALMFLGAHYFLEGSVAIAERLGVSHLVIGLTLVAAGTSFPELFTSLIAVLKGEPDLALGNIIGSSIFNILGILGCSGIICDLKVSPEVIGRDIPAMVGAGLLVWGFVLRHERVGRLAGVILFTLYCGYTAYLFAKG